MRPVLPLTEEQRVIAESGVRLAKFLADRFSRDGMFSFEDLFSVAQESLVVTASRWNPGRCPAPQYLALKVRFGIMDHIRRERKNALRVPSVRLDDCDECVGSSEFGNQERACDARVDLDHALSGVPSRTREILSGYYGIGMTDSEIGPRVGLSHSRVNDLRTKAIERLRWRAQTGEIS